MCLVYRGLRHSQGTEVEQPLSQGREPKVLLRTWGVRNTEDGGIYESTWTGAWSMEHGAWSMESAMPEPPIQVETEVCSSINDTSKARGDSPVGELLGPLARQTRHTDVTCVARQVFIGLLHVGEPRKVSVAFAVIHHHGILRVCVYVPGSNVNAGVHKRIRACAEWPWDRDTTLVQVASIISVDTE
ncbi:hypothetical protein CIB48_g9905 [Xylaria polymorpha]|nr:hypothetical protein CIB48_g9905 [Xylaria polymorpha]